MLDADAAEGGVVVGGDVAGGVDVWVAGAQVGVDDDAVVDDQTGVGSKLDGGFGADADKDQVGPDLLAVRKPSDRAVRCVFDRFDGGVEAEVDAVVAVEVCEDWCDFRTEDARQG